MTHHITFANSTYQTSGDALAAIGPDTLIVDEGAYLISGAAGNGATLTGSWTATVNGQISAFGSGKTVGLKLTSGSVTIGSKGIVSGSGDDPSVGIAAAGALDLTNFGSIHAGGHAILIAGKAEITNAGTIAGHDIQLGAANDSVTDFIKVGNTIKSGTATGVFLLGTGINKFLGGSHTETVQDDSGTDTVALGGGKDTYIATTRDPAHIMPGNDTLDGGAGVDTYFAGNDYTQIRVNLDGVHHGGILAHSAYGAAIGSDSLVNFENVVAGMGSDVIFGSGGRNNLGGGDGNDQLYGLGGRDVLTGGYAADTFHFLKLSDSGITASTRDIITDFHGENGDRIDLSAIDAKSTVTGNQAFHLTANSGHGAFTHHAGELRYQFTAGGDTLIVADVNGDATADLNILLKGHHLLHAGDFNL